MNLALQYRPASFEQIIGQKMVSVILSRMVEKDDVPVGLLFTGIHGTGKTTTARVLAAALNCEQEKRPCGECASCISIFSGSSLDYIEVDAASKGSVAEIRLLIDSLRYQQVGKYRVVTLDEAQSMSKEAYNALLKTLEEPPHGTIFILVTTEPHKILETVKSRLIEFAFKRVSPNDILDHLTHVADERVESDLLTHIAQEADGSVRNALMALDFVQRAEVYSLPVYREYIGDLDVAPLLLQDILTNDHAVMMKTLDDQLMVVGDPALVETKLIQLFRDLLVVRSGGTLHYTGTAGAIRHDLAYMLDANRIIAGLKLLWNLKIKISSTVNPRAYLETAVVILADVLNKGRETTKIVQPSVTIDTLEQNLNTSEKKKLSLAEMMQKAQA